MRDLDRYQAEYDALSFEAVQVRYRRKKVCELLARLRPRRVLEVGCGRAPLFLDYTDFAVMHVVEPGDRFHANAVASAKGRADVLVHHGTIEHVAPALAGEAFDAIVMSSVLHEVADPMTLLGAVKTLCSTGTMLHVVVPNARSFHRRLAVEMGLIDSVFERSPTQQRMQQSQTFDVEALQALLRASGFDVVDTGTFFIKPFTHAQMAALYEQRFLTDQMLDGLYAMSEHLPGIGSEIYVSARRAR